MTGFKILCVAATAAIAVPGAGMADDDVLRFLIRGINGGTIYHMSRDDDDDDGFRGRYVRGDHGYYRHGGRFHRDDDDDDGGRDDDDDD